MKAEFLRAAESPEHYPSGGLPEVAFAGRSNVGKSSLINTLVNRKSLVRTSKDPGRTRQLCFFSVEERVLFVDLPGYGYAKVAKSKVAAWSDLIQRYLKGRPELVRVLVLIDARHGLKPVDLETMKGLDEAAQSYQVVLTKADLVKPEARDALLQRTAAALSRLRAAHPEILLTSASDGTGIEALRAVLATLALAAPRR